MTTVETDVLAARDIARLVAEKKLSPVEVTEAAIKRIEARNPSLNAIIYKDFEGALARARDLERRIMQGANVGPLAGVPTLMKDLFDFRPGWPSTLGGIPALRNFIPDFWSAYPQRVERDDAMNLGKTNSPIMGFRGVTDNPLFGPTRNPFDTTRNSGGSSGGSAAAVADGLVSIAGASDGGGSIRIPSAWCGVAGFQPSFGRVPLPMRPNAFGGAAPFIFNGPIARNVSDLALAMNTLVGPDPFDPFSVEGTINFDSALSQSLKGKRVGFTVDFGVFPVDAKVAAVVSEAVRAFELVGAHVDLIDMKLPYGQHELSDLWCRQMSVAVFDCFEGLKAMGVDLVKDHRQDLPDPLVYWTEVAGAMSLAEMLRDQATRTQVYDAFAKQFMEYDFIVSPTTAILPVKNTSDGLTNGPATINGVDVDPQIGWCMTYMTNMTGHPAASLPAGLADGLPVGLQIIGRRHADLDVMAACAAFERARPWKAIYDIPAKRSLVL